MSRPRRVAVVGAGDMGARHATHWNAAGAQVALICDPDLPRAEAIAARVGAEASATPIDAVRGSDLDVVSVCTPTFLHAPVTIAALEAGRDVLCEKPVALTLADAEAMASAARSSGRRLRIGFMRRFDPIWLRVEHDVGRIGTPILAQAALSAGVRPKVAMHDAHVNGGPVIDMACHLFDRWERVFGRPPQAVHARGATFGADKPELVGVRDLAVDSVQVSVDYGAAGTGQIQLSWGLPAGIPASERHVYLGPGGVVETDGVTGSFADGGAPSVYSPSEADAWHDEIVAFARELDSGDPQGLADVQAGIRALRSSLAVLEAVSSGTTVPLEFRPSQAAPA